LIMSFIVVRTGFEPVLLVHYSHSLVNSIFHFAT